MSNSSATGAAARAAGYRACLRCLPDEVSREEAALGKAFRLLAAAEEAPSLDELAGGGRLFAAPFPPPVQARHRGDARGLLPEPQGAARRGRARRERADHRRDLRCRLFRPGALLCRRQEAARHDPLGLARRRARRDDPLGDRRDRSRHDAGRGDRQGHLPALLRRGRGGAAAPLPQGGDRAWRRRRWPIWSGGRWRR